MRRSSLFRSAAVAALTALGFATLGFTGAADAQTLRKIRVTVPTPSAMFYPLFYGEEKGFFAKEGMTVEVISTNGDGPDVDAVISRSVEFSMSTPNRLFTAFEQGRPLKAVMTVAQRMAIDCIVNKQFAEKAKISVDTPIKERILSLKGQTVAGTRPGAFTYVLLEIYAKRAGLVPQKDLKIIGVGGPNSMIPAVENNQIVVGCTGSPAVELAEARGKAVRFTNNAAGKDPAFDDFMFELIYAHPEMLAKEPDTVRKFLRALQISVASLQDTPTKELLPALKARYAGVDDEILMQAFDNIKHTYRRDGTITPTAVKKAGEFMLESGAIKKAATFEEIATNDFLPKP